MKGHYFNDQNVVLNNQAGNAVLNFNANAGVINFNANGGVIDFGGFNNANGIVIVGGGVQVMGQIGFAPVPDPIVEGAIAAINNPETTSLDLSNTGLTDQGL